MFKVGDRVQVHNQTLSGKSVLEGIGTVRRVMGNDRYMVQFDGDDASDTYERRVLADQTDKVLA